MGVTPFNHRRELGLLALVFAASSFCADESETQGIDCDALPEDKRALCQLLQACNQVEDEDARQRCFELALDEDGLEDQDELLEEIADWMKELGITVQDETEAEQDNAEESSQASAEQESDQSSEPAASTADKKPRGFFGRIGRALTAPIRGVLPKNRNQSDDTPTRDEASNEESSNNDELEEDDSDSESWTSKVKRAGRLDRNVHLVLLDDGNLFEYITSPELRFRKNDTIKVTYLNTWLTEGYKLEGPRGPIQDAHLIPCYREDVKGNIKRKCELMKVPIGKRETKAADDK